MITGAAGSDVHCLDSLEDLRRIGAKSGVQQFASRDALLQRLGYRQRLFVNFLEHEVPIVAPLGGIRRHIAFAYRTLHESAVGIQNLHGFAPNLRNVAFFQEHEAAGDRQ